MAAGAGMVELIQQVLEARIDPNPKMDDGRTKLLVVLVSMLEHDWTQVEGLKQIFFANESPRAVEPQS